MLCLIRTTCKAVHELEKSGHIFNFYTSLCEEVGSSNASFIHFKGNQFHLLFYNGGILYFLYNNLKRFENKLLKPVHSDLKIKPCLCGCRALDLINRFVTGPLWRS